LQEEINKMLSRGWKLQGGICYADFVYYQAIFKVKDWGLNNANDESQSAL